MNQLEILREKLYEMINSGDTDGILVISQELDRLILKYMSTKNLKKLA